MRTGRLSTLAWILALALAGVGCSEDSGSNNGGTDPGSPPEILLFSTETGNGSVLFGEHVNLRWQTPGATVASILPDIGEVRPAGGGAVNIRPFETVTFTLTASNDFGTVSAQTTVEVRYPGGIYVDSVDGDDSREGTSPQAAVKTLSTALVKAASLGVIYLSAGVYPTPVNIDAAHMEIYGGLNPETFFEEPDFPGLYDSIIQPAGGTPVTIRNTLDAVVLQNLILRAPAGANAVAEIENAGIPSRRVRLLGCTLDGRVASGGVALALRGTSTVTVDRCKIYGNRPGAVQVAAGVLIADASSAVITSCFIDGGIASQRASGIDVRSSASDIRLGFNTIGTELLSFGGENAATIRIDGSGPTIGGNILFTRGGGRRFGLLEKGPNSNPTRFEGNLFVSVGTPAYSNFEGEDAATQNDLNNYTRTTSNASFVTWGNLLETAVSASQMFRNIDGGDYHLQPLMTGNPAIDRGDLYLYNEQYGDVRTDIDGDDRPRQRPTETDIGADEHRF